MKDNYYFVTEFVSDDADRRRRAEVLEIPYSSNLAKELEQIEDLASMAHCKMPSLSPCSSQAEAEGLANELNDKFRNEDRLMGEIDFDYLAEMANEEPVVEEAGKDGKAAKTGHDER